MPERADFPMVVIGEVWSNSISLGAALIFALVLAFGGVFTLKSKLGSYWKEAYEEQLARANDCAAEAAATRASLGAELAETKEALAACRARTDLEPLIAAVHESVALSTSRHETWRTELTANTHMVRDLVKQTHTMTEQMGEVTRMLAQLVRSIELRNDRAQASNDRAAREGQES